MVSSLRKSRVPVVRGAAELKTEPVSRGVKLVGWLLGFSAALVGVRFPEALAALPSPSTILIFLALGVSVLCLRREDLPRLRGNIFDLVFLSYISLLSFVEVFNALDVPHEIAVGSITTQLILWASTWPARLVIRSKRDFRAFLLGLALPAVFVSVLAIAQMLRIEAVAAWIAANVNAGGLESRLEAGRTDIRATSTIGHWTALGGYLAVAGTLLCVELVLRAGDSVKRSGIWVTLGILIIFVGSVATLTFSTIAVLAAVLLVTFLKLGARITWVVLGGAAGLVGWSVFGAEVAGRLDAQSVVSRQTADELQWLPSTVAYRVRIWQNETLPALDQRPLTGWGQAVYDFPSWTQFPTSLSWASPESQWLGLAMRGGIIMLIAFVIVLILIFIVLHRSRVSLGGGYIVVVTMLVSLLATGLINSPFSTNGVPQILWPAIGAIMAAGGMRALPQDVVLPHQIASSMHRHKPVRS
ncbi:MAG: O-antigen ligase family protein [Pseudoclavibacter sp.]